MQKTCAFLFALGFLLLAGCGGGGKDNQEGPGGSDPDLSNINAAVSDGPYADVLPGCVSATTAGDSCLLAMLPLFAREHDNPTTDDIMTRVVVSHSWMADRFRQVLDRLPDDIKTLMKAVTAIVIDDDIRPSYYWTMTGAIYLDPAYLWLTGAEKDTISVEEDHRVGFGDELQFKSLWRFVKDNDYAYKYYSLTGIYESRPIEDIIYPLAALLYHELAHANDYFPPDYIESLDQTQSVYDASQSVAADNISSRLVAYEPLTSEILKNLGLVLFHGQDATDEQKALTAEMVGFEFQDDGANDDYNYSTIREDVAVLFQDVMLKYHFDIDRDVAYTDLPFGDDPACDDYIVRWGNRNRIGHPYVRPRARFVAENLLPTIDFSAFFQSLSGPLPMVNHDGWCENLTMGIGATTQGVKEEVPRTTAYAAYDARVHLDTLPPNY